MKWIPILFLLATDRDKGLTPTQSVGNLWVPAIILIIVILLVFLAQYMLRVYLHDRTISSDWEELEQLFTRFDLSREETHLLRSKLIKFRYAYPTKVLKKEIEFEKFRKRILKRPNHHIEFLLAVIYKKLFETKRKTVKKAAADVGSPASQESGDSPKNVADASST